MYDDVLKLTSIATGIKGGKIRLGGEILDVRDITIANCGPGGAARMMVNLSIHDPEKHETTCDCEGCQTRRAVVEAGANRVYSLISCGRHEKLVLDSSSVCEGGFSVKIRNTATRRCDVAEGPSLTLATARATKKALNA